MNREIDEDALLPDLLLPMTHWEETVLSPLAGKAQDLDVILLKLRQVERRVSPRLLELVRSVIGQLEEMQRELAASQAKASLYWYKEFGLRLVLAQALEEPENSN